MRYTDKEKAYLDGMFKGIFITPETREFINKVHCPHSSSVIATTNDLVNAMDIVLKDICVNNITGQDFIIRTPERGIGKTRAILYLADNYNLPIICGDVYHSGEMIKRSKEMSYGEPKTIWFRELNKKMEGHRDVRTVLIDEDMDISVLREQDCMKGINVVGINHV